MFYHRQLREAAEERYREDRTMLHHTMATYFGDLADRTKGVAQQPMTASLRGLTVSVWLSTAKVNKRRCVEAGTHMLGAGLFIEMVKELCSLESVCARAKADEVFTMLQQLIDLQKKKNSASQRGTAYGRTSISTRTGSSASRPGDG